MTTSGQNREHRADRLGTGVRIVGGVPHGAVSPEKYQVRFEFDVLTPMRDGVLLAMDLLRPDAPGRFPVILMRTPYSKTAVFDGPRHTSFQEQLARRGYIVAIQDCRGRFNSDGEFDPYRQEHADGFDTVNWLADQEWCDGNVGMIGGSYVAQTQWQAASQVPTALKAIVPTASPPGHAFLNEPLWGGAFLLAMAEWMFAMGRRSVIGDMETLFSRDQPYFKTLPIADITKACGISSPWWTEWMSHPTYDEFWRSCGYEEFWPRIKVPALNITGWWDMNFLGAHRNFVGMRQLGATKEAREGQRIVIGPWPHLLNRSRSLSGMDFGPTAMTNLEVYTLRFFDYWLRGLGDNGLDHDARTHVFVIGVNEWWEADEWPLPGTHDSEFYLHSDGTANSHHGDGTLSENRPGDEPCDKFISRPLDPVRAVWSLHEGPVDDSPVSARADVLCYTSEVLTEPLYVAGPVTTMLYASSSARDCDWHVRLVDVHQDGTARFLCHGVLRARFREGYDSVHLLEPEVVERFEIDMTAVGVCFLQGHRIRVEVSSTWFSRFECNLQTGAENWMTDEGLPVTANQKIHHSAEYPSHIKLPIVLAPPL